MPEVMDKVNCIVLESLSELLQEKFQKYDKVATSFQGFFNAEDLMSQLDRKVDNNIMSQMIDKKADKIEFTQFHTVLDDFEKKLKHISVFLTQISMALHKDKDKVKLTENQNIIKNENLLSQSKVICNWIMNRNIERNSAASISPVRENESQGSDQYGQN